MPGRYREDISLIVDTWERTGSVSVTDIERLEALRAEDPKLFRSIRPLIPLMRLDAGMDELDFSDESIDVSDEVMLRVERERTRRRFPQRRLTPIVAAAAVLTVVAATLLGLLAFGPRGPETVVVRFELSAPEAEQVALVGDFNDWEPGRSRLEDLDGDGVWEIEVELEQDRVYTYNFLVNDSEWIADPSAETQVRDSFGGEKSVLNL